MTDHPYHIIIETIPKKDPGPGKTRIFTPTPFFVYAGTINQAVMEARGEASQRGLYTSYVRCARRVHYPEIDTTPT